MTEGALEQKPKLEWLPPSVLLGLGLLLFPSSGRDDKFITYWPAHTLASWGEIVNYNGDRIEQSSSLLHVLLIALATKISSAPPEVTGWFISVAGGMFGVWLTGRTAERCQRQSGFAAAMLLAVGAPYAYWAFSGMETTIVAASALGMCLAVSQLGEAKPGPKSLLFAGLPITAYLLVRPESPIVLFCVLAGLVGLGWLARFVPQAEGDESRFSDSPLDAWLPAAALSAVLAAIILVFRLAYFDSPMPQPVFAKSTPLTLSTIKGGVFYLFREGANWILIPLAFVGALKVLWQSLSGRSSSLRTSLALFLVAYTSFIILSGGGWMEATRFVGQMFPVIAILCIEAIRWVPRPEMHRSLAAALIVVGVLGSVRIAQVHSSSMPLWAILQSERVEDDRYPWIVRYNLSNRRDIEMVDAAESVVSRLVAANDEKVPILAYNTGMVMYYTTMKHFGELVSIDLHGLSDRYVTHSRYNDSIRRFPLGLRWGHLNFYEIYPDLHEDTGVPYPYVVFCAAWPMDARGVAWVPHLDFFLAYWQLRDFEAGTNFLPGRGVRASQILAVQGDRAGPLADFPAVAIPKAPVK